MELELHLKLISDATFGRGDGVAGLVDEEVEHDAATGLPFLRGRTLKGLLVEECANILYALSRQSSSVDTLKRFQSAARRLFGQAGSTITDDAEMRVGSALLPEELRQAVQADVEAQRLKPAEVLESLTAIRRQTAIGEQTDAPEEGSLRSMRVTLRDTPFVAKLRFYRKPDEDMLALLASCALSLRRAGTGRNRGRGRLNVERLVNKQGDDIIATSFTHFRAAVKGGA